MRFLLWPLMAFAHLILFESCKSSEENIFSGNNDFVVKVDVYDEMAYLMEDDKDSVMVEIRSNGYQEIGFTDALGYVNFLDIPIGNYEVKVNKTDFHGRQTSNLVLTNNGSSNVFEEAVVRNSTLKFIDFGADFVNDSTFGISFFAFDEVVNRPNGIGWAEAPYQLVAHFIHDEANVSSENYSQVLYRSVFPVLHIGGVDDSLLVDRVPEYTELRIDKEKFISGSTIYVKSYGFSRGCFEDEPSTCTFSNCAPFDEPIGCLSEPSKTISLIVP